MKKTITAIIVMIIVVVAFSLAVAEMQAVNKNTSSQTSLNKYVRNHLNGPLSSFQIDGSSYKSFNKPIAVNNVMRSFYILENESVFKEYYLKGSQNLTASLSAVYHNYNNTTDPYGLKQVNGTIEMYYELPVATVNGTMQPQMVQYVEFVINASTGKINGPILSQYPLVYMS